MPPSLLIVSDDLTGAADCAARCRAAGLQATVALRPVRDQLLSGVLAITSDSRHLDPDQAAMRVRQLTAGLSHVKGASWYKKIDSTLRGNLGSELDALLDTLDRTHAIICPAFPDQRRGLQSGYLVADGVEPGALHLPTLLAQQSLRQLYPIDLRDVRAGVQHLAAQLRASARHAQLLVVDAMTNADLHTIVAAVKQALPDALFCGSAGLAGALANAQAITEQDAGTTTARDAPPDDRPALIVVGSGSRAAHAQIAYLRGRDTLRLVEAGSAQPVDWRGDILLHLPPPTSQNALEGPEAREAAGRLAEAAHAAINRTQPTLLVLVGGDTAIAVLGRLGVEQLTVQRELLPGMPLTWGVGRTGQRYTVILKAGNHGDEATLETLLRLARQHR